MIIESLNYKEIIFHGPMIFLFTRMPVLCVKRAQIIIKTYREFYGKTLPTLAHNGFNRK